MSLEVWLSFTITTIVLVAVPGPVVMLVVSYALGRGKRTAWATVPGVALGDFVAMTIALLGAGAILAASAILFTVLKIVGALYLIWIGIQMWRSNPTPEEILENNPLTEHRKMFWKAFTVTALNPKGIVFFVAFVPQFVDASKDTFGQFIILETTFIIVAALNVTLWALLANAMRAKFASVSARKLVARASGSFLMGAGLLTAFARRAS